MGECFFWCARPLISNKSKQDIGTTAQEVYYRHLGKTNTQNFQIELELFQLKLCSSKHVYEEKFSLIPVPLSRKVEKVTYQLKIQIPIFQPNITKITNHIFSSATITLIKECNKNNYVWPYHKVQFHKLSRKATL